jgi:hypothetical protein
METRERPQIMKIFSQGDFHNFKGFVDQGIPEELLLFKFSDGAEIKVTPDHSFLIGKSWIDARLLDMGDFINGKEVMSVTNIKPENVYDAFDVENVHSYFTNGVESHNCNLLYIDEAAFIPTNIADQFFTSVYPTISAGQTTKILLSSTPKGYNHFWKFWNDSEQGNNDFKNLFIPYSDIPGRDENWLKEQRNLLGELKYNQEVLCLGPDSKITLRDKLTGKIFHIKIGEFYQFL